MKNLEQDLPPYDIRTLRAQPFPERLRLICRTWAFQVNATPRIVYLGYVLKILLLFVGGWCFFCSFSPAWVRRSRWRHALSRQSPSRRPSSGRSPTKVWTSAARPDR
jgi:hypothetical protein